MSTPVRKLKQLVEVKSHRSRYSGYRFPPQIISYAVWACHRFFVSFRDVEDLLAERRIIVSYETIRQWCEKFGPNLTSLANGSSSLDEDVDRAFEPLEATHESWTWNSRGIASAIAGERSSPRYSRAMQFEALPFSADSTMSIGSRKSLRERYVLSAEHNADLRLRPAEVSSELLVSGSRVQTMYMSLYFATNPEIETFVGSTSC